MHLLTQHDYAQAAPLFQPLDFHLAVPYALQGHTPAQLFTDGPLRPSSALLWVQHTIFLAGAPDNASFNESLYHLFEETIFPSKPRDGFVLTWENPGWEQALQQVILRDHPPVPGPRQHYALDLTQPGALPAGLPDLPSGLALRPVDPALAADRAYTNLDDLLEELLSERPTIEAFLEHSFGTCIVSPDRIVTWCLSEYNLGERCEVGIATHPEYQGRGLATLTGQAFLLQAWRAGIRRVGWHCWTRNEASGKTALKTGLRKERDYPACFALADRAAHLSVHGEIALYQGAFAEAAGWFERAALAGSLPDWACVNAARAYARLEQPEAAFRCLAMALEKGYQDIAGLEEDEHLQSLRGTERWESFLKQARAKQV